MAFSVKRRKADDAYTAPDARVSVVHDHQAADTIPMCFAPGFRTWVSLKHAIRHRRRFAPPQFERAFSSLPAAILRP